MLGPTLSYLLCRTRVKWHTSLVVLSWLSLMSMMKYFFSQILENILITNVLKEIRRKHKSDKKYKMQDDANL
ncbi:hypothetical protein BUQ74_07680 [Leptospira weilii serovar Heyan]|nr:hypothetical protein BUQ74_07680 [Leptospira weilii serovar Heyan]